MKQALTLTLAILLMQACLSQTIIKLKNTKENSVMPCKIDGVIVSAAINAEEPVSVISVQEVLYLLGNDNMEHIDILGKETSNDSFFVYLRKVEFAGFTLYNIKARVLKNSAVPFIFGETDIKQLGNFSYSDAILSIKKGNANFDYASFKEPKQDFDQPQSEAFSATEPVVNVNIFDKEKNPIPNLMVIITGHKKRAFYQGFVDNTGSLALQLPADDKYDLTVLGPSSFLRTLSFLEIPALKDANSRYIDPFIANIEYSATQFIASPNFFFEKNKYVVDKSAYKKLDTLSEYLARKVNYKIELNGYTDSTETNQIILSSNRAKSIRDYLIANHIDSNRIAIKGNTFLRTPGNVTNDAYRRTEVKLIDPFTHETYLANDTATIVYLTQNDENTFISSGTLDKEGKKQGIWHEYELRNESFYRKRNNETPTQYEGRYLVYGEGNYVNNAKTGSWSFYLIEETSHNKTLIKKTTFVNDQENGAFQYFYGNGNVAQTGSYINGGINGSSTIYFEDNKVFAELLFKNNEKDGEEKYYYPNGTLKLLVHYKKGEKDGEEKSYYETGILEESCTNSKGKLDGAFRYYYPNGKIWTERIYNNDLLEKLTILVDKNGKDLDKGTFKNGNGVIHFYTEFGQVYLSVTFKDGKEISEE
jgi:antitoxin component YwqK of YwqJK toxin-antitoxin module/outer membrane protein OmpA-like peptidoglycan-associated protein